MTDEGLTTDQIDKVEQEVETKETQQFEKAKEEAKKELQEEMKKELEDFKKQTEEQQKKQLEERDKKLKEMEESMSKQFDSIQTRKSVPSDAGQEQAGQQPPAQEEKQPKKDYWQDLSEEERNKADYEFFKNQGFPGF